MVDKRLLLNYERAYFLGAVREPKLTKRKQDNGGEDMADGGRSPRGSAGTGAQDLMLRSGS